MHPLYHWLQAPRGRRQASVRALFSNHWPPHYDFAQLVLAPEQWGVFASIGPHFQYAIFGRDSIETAEDLLDTHPKLVRHIICTLCKLQGTKTDRISEEEPGKIHHEYRALQLNSHPIPEHSQAILRELQHVWGGDGTDTMVYYGSHDATPLFIRLVGRYVDKYGEQLLHTTLSRRDGGTVSVRDCLVAALDWVSGKIASQPVGLFPYKRLNPNGLANQSWKDSYTSYLHADGATPNFDGGIVSIELQGYAYDALQAGIRLGLGSNADRQRWHEQAEQLRDQTVASLWMEDQHYFAQGLDIDAHGQPRQIATITSNPAAFLDSQLLYDLPPDQSARYVAAIARMVYSAELLTPVGVRCRAIRHWDLLGYIDYHGPNTVWPKETFDIAKGFRRAGLPHLAADLEHRLVHSLEEAGEFSEFFYVSRNGKVWYDRDEALAHFGAESPGQTLPVPEPGQAWTIAAAIRIAATRAPSVQPPSPLEQSLLAA